MSPRKYWDLIGVVLLGITIHILPFLFYGKDPLGYDGGFYRRYLIEHINFLHSVPGLGSEALLPKFTFDALKLFHIPVDLILYGSLIGLYAATTIALYFLVRKYADRRLAIFAALFFVLSPVQYFGYWCVLYKNIYGILILIITALWMHRRSPWMYLGAALIACTHQTTSAVFLISLVVFALIDKKSRRETILMFCLSAALLVCARFASIGTDIVSLPQASFLSWSQYLTLSMPLLFLALIGAWQFMKSNKGSFLFAFSIVSMLYPILHLPFYQRVFLFTDLSVVIFAAYGIAFLLSEELAQRLSPDKNLGKIIACTFLIGICLMLTDKVSALRASVTLDQIAELEKIDTMMPAGSYVLTDSQLTPWVEGFSHMHVIAPTLLFDNHSETEWTEYWSLTSAPERIPFLDSFNKPLYTFLPPDEQEEFIPDECANKLTGYISQYICP